MTVPIGKKTVLPLASLAWQPSAGGGGAVIYSSVVVTVSIVVVSQGGGCSVGGGGFIVVLCFERRLPFPVVSTVLVRFVGAIVVVVVVVEVVVLPLCLLLGSSRVFSEPMSASLMTFMDGSSFCPCW